MIKSDISPSPAVFNQRPASSSSQREELQAPPTPRQKMEKSASVWKNFFESQESWPCTHASSSSSSSSCSSSSFSTDHSKMPSSIGRTCEELFMRLYLTKRPTAEALKYLIEIVSKFTPKIIFYNHLRKILLPSFYIVKPTAPQKPKGKTPVQIADERIKKDEENYRNKVKECEEVERTYNQAEQNNHEVPEDSLGKLNKAREDLETKIKNRNKQLVALLVAVQQAGNKPSKLKGAIKALEKAEKNVTKAQNKVINILEKPKNLRSALTQLKNKIDKEKEKLERLIKSPKAEPENRPVMDESNDINHFITYLYNPGAFRALSDKRITVLKSATQLVVDVENIDHLNRLALNVIAYVILKANMPLSEESYNELLFGNPNKWPEKIHSSIYAEAIEQEDGTLLPATLLASVRKNYTRMVEIETVKNLRIQLYRPGTDSPNKIVGIVAEYLGRPESTRYEDFIHTKRRHTEQAMPRDIHPLQSIIHPLSGVKHVVYRDKDFLQAAENLYTIDPDSVEYLAQKEYQFPLEGSGNNKLIKSTLQQKYDITEELYDYRDGVDLQLRSLFIKGQQPLSTEKSVFPIISVVKKYLWEEDTPLETPKGSSLFPFALTEIRRKPRELIHNYKYIGDFYKNCDLDPAALSRAKIGYITTLFKIFKLNDHLFVLECHKLGKVLHNRQYTKKYLDAMSTKTRGLDIFDRRQEALTELTDFEETMGSHLEMVKTSYPLFDFVNGITNPESIVQGTDRTITELLENMFWHRCEKPAAIFEIQTSYIKEGVPTLIIDVTQGAYPFAQETVAGIFVEVPTSVLLQTLNKLKESSTEERDQEQVNNFNTALNRSIGHVQRLLAYPTKHERTYTGSN